MGSVPHAGKVQKPVQVANTYLIARGISPRCIPPPDSPLTGFVMELERTFRPKSSIALQTSMLAITQTAAGCGIGLLIAGKLGRPTQKVTAASLLSLAALLALPAIV